MVMVLRRINTTKVTRVQRVKISSTTFSKRLPWQGKQQWLRGLTGLIELRYGYKGLPFSKRLPWQGKQQWSPGTNQTV